MKRLAKSEELSNQGEGCWRILRIATEPTPIDIEMLFARPGERRNSRVDYQNVDVPVGDDYDKIHLKPEMN